MSNSEVPGYEALLEAAALAFAMVRFAGGAAHPARGSVPPGTPRLGDEAFVFAPSSRWIRHAEVAPFLAALPSPALLFPTTTRGIVSLVLLAELSGERAVGAQKEFASQQSLLAQMVGMLGLAPDSRILLQFGNEELVVTLAVLQLWSGRFIIGAGWNLSSLADDSRAVARLNLFRSDGINTPDSPV